MAGSWLSRFAVCLLAVTAGQFSFGAREDPYRLLAMAIDPHSRLNIEAVVRMTQSGSPTRVVKLLADCHDRRRISVLMPISEEGTEVLLLGDTTEVYIPDAKVLHVTQSAPRHQPLALRLKLLHQNYVVKMKSSGDYQGRKVYRIQARPVHSASDSIEVLVDQRTTCALKMTMTSADRRSVNVLETLNVTYPTWIDPQRFAFKASEATVVKDPSPTEVKSMSAAKRLLGATPKLPKRLPLGFKAVSIFYSDTTMSSAEVDGSSNSKAPIHVRTLDIELCDGLMVTTVHESLRRGMPPEILSALKASKRHFEVTDDLILTSRGDLSPVMEKALLAGFVGRH